MKKKDGGILMRWWYSWGSGTEKGYKNVVQRCLFFRARGEISCRTPVWTVIYSQNSNCVDTYF